MDGLFEKKRITPLDIYFGGSLLSILLIFAINISIKSKFLVYVSIALVLISLFYCTKSYKSESGPLQDLWIMGLLSTILYPLIDSFFADKIGLVTYLTDDPKLISTPVYILLYWILGVLLFGYFFYRIRGITHQVVTAALATGLFSAVSTTIVENFFNAMGFYMNTPGCCMFGSIPAYVPLGYLVAFSFIPIYIRYKYICGFLLYGLVGICWYILSLVLS